MKTHQSFRQTVRCGRADVEGSPSGSSPVVVSLLAIRRSPRVLFRMFPTGLKAKFVANDRRVYRCSPSCTSGSSTCMFPFDSMLSECVARREEMAVRARRRREANRERKKRLERRRQKEAEATRIKHEGPSLAEVVRAIVAKRSQHRVTARKPSLPNMQALPFSAADGRGFPMTARCPVPRRACCSRTKKKKAPGVIDRRMSSATPPPPPPLPSCHAESL